MKVKLIFYNESYNREVSLSELEDESNLDFRCFLELILNGDCPYIYLKGIRFTNPYDESNVEITFPRSKYYGNNEQK